MPMLALQQQQHSNTANNETFQEQQHKSGTHNVTKVILYR
jgi:hypothetical protein